ncbi:MAG: glutamine synthetase family protein [Bacilli bacterium]|nr:glutamine synthetase family protein [Bacilli bacterium]
MKNYEIDDVKKLGREENVRYLKLQFTDMLGTIKSVEVPFSRFDDVVANRIVFDGSSIEGFVRIKETDMHLHPDLSTFLILPLETSDYGKVARIICDVHLPDGSPFIGDPRNNLKRVLNEIKNLGFGDLNIGLEPEFYLFKPNDKGDIAPLYSDQGSYFDLAPLDGCQLLRRDIVLELEKICFAVETSHHEVGPGQNEINFHFSSALAACDNVQTFKQIVKQTARKHGLFASFMPKPVTGIPGNGMHFNCSLTDNAGRNLFFDSEAPKGLSPLALKWISGIIYYARELTLITNPIVNSYKRLISGYEAPGYICWSDSNRSAMIRIPTARGAQTRTEIRNVDCAANPYLVAAAVLAAGIEGIVSDIELIPPVDDNIYAMSDEVRCVNGIKNLPENLKEAICEFSRSALMKKTLGEHIFQKYMIAKKAEWEQYRILVHPWELEHYL